MKFKNEKMKLLSYLFCLISSLVIINCNKEKDNTNDSNSHPLNGELVIQNQVHSLQADTIKLYLNNGSLSPDYQFYQEWILTVSEAIITEQKGRNPEKVIHKKMDPVFWKSIRYFNPIMTDIKDTLEIDGAEERLIYFIVKDKKYKFPVSVMEEKANRIYNYFN